MKNVLIADDHQITRRGIKALLTEHYEDIHVVEAHNGQAALEQLPFHIWSFILLDIIMPGGNIGDLIRAVRKTHHDTPILILTAAAEVGYVFEILKAGANGLIHKTRPAQELIAAITSVCKGEVYLHPETAAQASAALDSKPTSVHDKLSTRELQIFRLIANGQTVKEIASDLKLSDKTVATYLARIREKTGLTTHVEIARYALQKSLVK